VLVSAPIPAAGAREAALYGIDLEELERERFAHGPDKRPARDVEQGCFFDVDPTTGRLADVRRRQLHAVLVEAYGDDSAGRYE